MSVATLIESPPVYRPSFPLVSAIVRQVTPQPQKVIDRRPFSVDVRIPETGTGYDVTY